MILVDTSVLIGFLKGSNGRKVKLFREVLQRKVPYGISALTLQEVLQGARTEADFKTLKEYLSTQRIYYLGTSPQFYAKATEMYFQLRRKGVTPRSSIDLLIALTAIENDLVLLHDDRDYDFLAENIGQLKILGASANDLGL